MSPTWTAQAEVLADVDSIGGEIAFTAGRCRATGLDPRSYAAIMGAAMALGCRPWNGMKQPYLSDEDLIGDLLESEWQVRQREGDYIRLRSRIVRAQAHASVSFTGAAARGEKAAMNHWQAVYNDCVAALDVLAPLPRRLRHARTNLMRAPAELGQTYEAVYELLSQGHVMPYEGRFITGEETPC